MFARRNHHNDSFSKHRAGKSVSTSRTKRSVKENAPPAKRTDKPSKPQTPTSPPMANNLTSPIITLNVGPTSRLFAAHQDILNRSPFFIAATRGAFIEAAQKHINLPDEVPEVFSCVLEYLYKGDYTPRLLHNKRRNAWELEEVPSNNDNNGGGSGTVDGSTLFHPGANMNLLKDTLIYCAADRYGLDELKRLALRKQGLQSGISVGTILSSARFAYANTPDSDSRLRAHYLALIIRSRNTFKRSGTMQMEMEAGGSLFFDLFVAMCNHMDDISTINKSPKTPKTPR